MPEPKVYAKRLVKGSAIIFVSLIASQFVAFLLRMFLARSLSVAEYGLFYAVFAFLSFFTLFRGLGFGSALIKYIPEFGAKKQFGKIKSSIVFSLALHAALSFFIVSLILIFSGEIVLGFFKTESAVPILQILLIWFLATIFLLFGNVFIGFQNMAVYALLQFLRNLLIFLFAFLLVGYFGFGIRGAAFAYLFEMLVIAVLAFAILRRKYPSIFRAKTFITKPLIKKLSTFALPLFLSGIGGIIIAYMDTLMITASRSLSEVGLYQAAQPAAHFLWYLVGPLIIVFFPMVSELWARGKKKLLGNTLHFLIKFSFILIIPAALIFIAFPDIIINLLFGPRYLAGATVLQILGAAAIVYTLYAILGSTINGIGKPIVNTKIIALMACLNFGGNLILIPIYGIEGAAIATIISYILGLVLTFYYAWKFVKFTVPASSLLKTLGGGVLTLFLIFGLKYIIVLPPWPEAFAVTIPSLVFYGVWILATKAITKDDLRLIAEVVPMPRWLVTAAGKLVRK